jgi:hypothetical protein
VQVHCVTLGPQAAVFIPVRLAGPQQIADCGQRGHVLLFVCRIGDDEIDVDAVLGRKPWNSRRPDMLDGESARAKCGPDVVVLAGSARRWRAPIRATVQTGHCETVSVREPERFRAAVRSWAGGGTDAATAAGVARELADDGLTTVVLVEGVSDQNAVEALAALRNRDLASEGVCVLPIGGAMGIAKFLRLFGRRGLAVNVRGICDEAEEGHVRRGLEQAGFDPGLNRTAMEALGFFVCVSDLEDELIRALGAVGVERVLTAEEDLARFRVFQNQPAQRGRPVEPQLRRFMGTTSGRKARYASRLVLALGEDRAPRPLDHLLASI